MARRSPVRSTCSTEAAFDGFVGEEDRALVVDGQNPLLQRSQDGTGASAVPRDLGQADLEILRRTIEDPCQLGQLVLALDGNPCREISGREPSCSAHEGSEAAGEGRRQQGGEHDGHEDAKREPEELRALQAGNLLFDLLCGQRDTGYTNGSPVRHDGHGGVRHLATHCDAVAEREARAGGEGLEDLGSRAVVLDGHDVGEAQGRVAEHTAVERDDRHSSPNLSSGGVDDGVHFRWSGGPRQRRCHGPGHEARLGQQLVAGALSCITPQARLDQPMGGEEGTGSRQDGRHDHAAAEA